VTLATEADVASLAALRRAWSDPADDPEYEQRFAQWWERESRRRLTWLAREDGAAVGMLNMAVFERMPRPMGLPESVSASAVRPGRQASQWGYIANVFVLAEHRNRGVGRRLLDAAVDHARSNAYVRLVLSPSERSIPFYRRAGFRAADELLVMPL
jgi:GNAT superfamily N-acetyltransferase